MEISRIIKIFQQKNNKVFQQKLQILKIKISKKKIKLLNISLFLVISKKNVQNLKFFCKFQFLFHYTLYIIHYTL